MRTLPCLALAFVACAAPPALHEPTVEIATHEAASRPDDFNTSDLYHYDRGDNVVKRDTAGGHFRLHYTTSGRHKVPSRDGDANGVPDFVDTAEAAYEAAWARYHGVLGFRQPILGPSETRFAVYFVDFGGSGDGAFREEACDRTHPDQCRGFMVQENDFAGYGYSSTRDANLILASHEYFHAVQAAYDAHLGTIPSEGCAVWATEDFEGRLSDFEGFIGGYLDVPSRSLDEPIPGPVDPFSYGSAIFFQFLGERYGETILREIWEHAVDGADGVADPFWLDAVEHALAMHDSNFAEAFTEFGEWNLRLGTWADGNGYRNAAHYPGVALETDTLPFQDDKLRVFHASTQYTSFPPAGRTQLAAALIPPEGGTLEGLVVQVAVRTAGHETYVTRIAEPAKGTQAIDLAGASAVVVIVTNTQRAGASLRPGMCVGSPEETAACVKALSPVVTPDPDPEPTPEAGGGDDAGGCSQGGLGAAAWGMAMVRIARRRRGVSRR